MDHPWEIASRLARNSRSSSVPVLLRSLVHVPHVPDENVLAVGLVSAEIAEKLGRRAAHGAQVTLETRLPRVPLSTLRAHVWLAHVLPEIVGLLRGRTYKIRRNTIRTVAFRGENFYVPPIKKIGENNEIITTNIELNTRRVFITKLSEIKRNRIFISPSLFP